MVTAIIGQDFYKTELLTSSNHSMIADEPTDVGGENAGPAPGEFLLGALASCTAITLRMYANRKNFVVTQIRVEVAMEKVNNVSVFQRSIYLEGALTDEQRKRLLQIAEACPVHKSLTNPIEIKSQLL